MQEGNPAHLLEAARQKGEVSSQSVLLVPHQQLCLLGVVLKLLGSVPSLFKPIDNFGRREIKKKQKQEEQKKNRKILVHGLIRLVVKLIKTKPEPITKIVEHFNDVYTLLPTFNKTRKRKQYLNHNKHDALNLKQHFFFFSFFFSSFLPTYNHYLCYIY